MKIARAKRRLMRWHRAQQRHERANGGMCPVLPGYRRLLIGSINYQAMKNLEGPLDDVVWNWDEVDE